MTRPQVDLQAEINKLSAGHPPTTKDKYANRIFSLKKMQDFYEGRIEGAPFGQAVVFKRFVLALAYTSNVILMYHDLTKKLARLADKDLKK